ncbi:MAG TPA: endonuclease domain-containing protein [Sphingomonas sp.]
MKRPPGEEPLRFQREARHNMSEPEKRLWQAIRNRKVADAKFRKQTWLGPFLVDFFCAEARLVIEVDGDTHAHQQDYDARRTAWIEREGFRVIRFSNDDVMRNLDGVVSAIEQALTLPPGSAGRAHPSPLQGEG